jgi:hypothetical protein
MSTEAQKQIDAFLWEAEQALRKAEAVADKHRIPIHWNFEYGMGGTYYPERRGYNKADILRLIRDGKFYTDLTEEEREAAQRVLEGNATTTAGDEWGSSYEGWVSSSQLC